MTEKNEHTVGALAEIIADQAADLKQLREEIDEQNDIIAEYELEQEESEKIDAALYAELNELVSVAIAHAGDATVDACDLQQVLFDYFEDFE